MILKDNRIQIVILLMMLAISWHSLLITPLKLFVVFLHELSHAIATWLTGGRVTSFVVSENQSGHVISVGGVRFIILSAGYLGSLLFGLAFYRLSRRNKSLDFVLFVLIFLLVIIAVFFAGTMYTTLYTLALALTLFCLYRFANLWIKQLSVLIFACASIIYIPIDIWQDTILRSDSLSDARMLAQEFGGVTLMWGGLWLVISGYFIYLTFRNIR